MPCASCSPPGPPVKFGALSYSIVTDLTTLKCAVVDPVDPTQCLSFKSQAAADKYRIDNGIAGLAVLLSG